MREAAAVLVIRDGLVLALKHATRGYCLPCGKVQPDEPTAVAACREAREETGYCVRVVAVTPFVGYDNDEFQVTTFLAADAIHVEPVDPREGAVEWVDPDVMLDSANRYHEYNRSVLLHFGLLNSKI
jgi:8-oxo-dGTP pyrophosphatase MutT (NUDIX family)